MKIERKKNKIYTYEDHLFVEDLAFKNNIIFLDLLFARQYNKQLLGYSYESQSLQNLIGRSKN